MHVLDRSILISKAVSRRHESENLQLISIDSVWKINQNFRGIVVDVDVVFVYGVNLVNPERPKNLRI